MSAMKPFLALGDSYTMGEGVAPAERWPVQLAARMRGEGVELAEPCIIATTGWTTDELAAAMEATRFDPPYRLVTLLIGVNNQYRGRAVGEYREQFRALLQRAAALAGGVAAHVVVVSIPDWGVTRFAAAGGRDPTRIAREIDTFNTAARVEAAGIGAHWADITTVSRSPDARDELVDDGLHPSGVQYARWVDVILPVARAALHASTGSATCVDSMPGTKGGGKRTPA